MDSAQRLLELEVFLLDLVDSYSDDVNHVAEDSSSNNLDDGYEDSLYEVTWRYIAIANGDHGCVGPIVRIDI